MSRRFQFSLRTLLVQMTLACVGIAFLAEAVSAPGTEWFLLYELAAAAFGASFLATFAGAAAGLVGAGSG